MRYTGEYQIQRSREEELEIRLCLPGRCLAFPGDRVGLRLDRMGLAGEYRVAEAESEAAPDRGETCTLTLRGSV